MSSSGEKAAARAPRRERGKRRVAALLEAATALFAEKGYDAVTMTEIAARAAAPIGSLYQFFPGKEALADAILARFGDKLTLCLTAIEERVAEMTDLDLAECLLGLLAGMRTERAAASALIESRQEASALAAELKRGLRRHVARILRRRVAGLSPARAEIKARVVVELMKAAARQEAEGDRAVRNKVRGELRQVMALYLTEQGSRCVGG